jgi:hypothetical protein
VLAGTHQAGSKTQYLVEMLVREACGALTPNQNDHLTCRLQYWNRAIAGSPKQTFVSATSQHEAAHDAPFNRYLATGRFMRIGDIGKGWPF